MCGLWSPSARPSDDSKECWVPAGVTGRQDPVEPDIHLTNVFLQRNDQSWGRPQNTDGWRCWRKTAGRRPTCGFGRYVLGQGPPQVCVLGAHCSNTQSRCFRGGNLPFQVSQGRPVISCSERSPSLLFLRRRHTSCPFPTWNNPMPALDSDSNSPACR